VMMAKATQGVPSHVVGHEGPMVTIEQLSNGWNDYWSANGYEIKEGRVVTETTVKKTLF
jgi:hypothetical protein